MRKRRFDAASVRSARPVLDCLRIGMRSPVPRWNGDPGAPCVLQRALRALGVRAEKQPVHRRTGGR